MAYASPRRELAECRASASRRPLSSRRCWLPSTGSWAACEALAPGNPFYVGLTVSVGRAVAVGRATSIGLGVGGVAGRVGVGAVAYGSLKVAVLAPYRGTATGCVIVAPAGPVTASPNVTTAPAVHPPVLMLTSYRV
jgi:hypothetical protein